jgi:competence protein ComEC
MNRSDQTEPDALPATTNESVTASIRVRDWFAASPLVPTVTGLIVGIIIDAWWGVPLAAVVVTWMVAVGGIALARRSWVLVLLATALAATATGALLHDATLRRIADDHLVRYCGPDDLTCRITATVITAPRVVQRRSGRINWYLELPGTRLLVSAESIESIHGNIPVSGLVSVRVPEPVLDVAPGDRLRLVGEISRPTPPGNPGERDWALFLRRRGILVQMNCKQAAAVQVVADGARPLHRAVWSLRRRLRASMLDDTYTGDVPGSQLLSAMVLGQRTAVEPDLNQAFVSTGTVHYLSVSGAHVGMLASVVWLAGMLLGASRRGCAIWTFAIITLYALVAEPRPAILRAALMADVLCLAVWLRRPARSSNWLALAAIILLVIRPTQLFEPGFQLSFLTLAAILFISPRLRETTITTIRRLRRRDDPLLMPDIQRMLNPPSRLRAAGNWILNVLGWWLAISIAAWTVGVLLSAYHFRQIAPWGWLNSILVMPLVWTALVIGFAKSLLGLIVPAAAGWFATPLVAITDLLIALVQRLDRLPGSGASVIDLPLGLIVLALAALVFWSVRPSIGLRPRALLVPVVLLVSLATYTVAPLRDGRALRVDVLAVGDGTACLIRLPDGRAILYDCGSHPPYDMIRWTVGPALTHRRVARLEAVLLSHPNIDHFSALPDLVDRFPVGCIITTPHFAEFAVPESATRRLLDDPSVRSLPMRAITRGQPLSELADCGADIEVLWPPPPVELDIARSNDSSLVLRIRYAGSTILLCGDIEEDALQHLVGDFATDLHADVLVMPHHGRPEDSTARFIKAVAPRFCISSTGQRQTTLPESLTITPHELITSIDGAIEVLIQPGHIKVRPFRSRSDNPELDR